ncbi:LPXTG cell wall anchor domain-containing protein, partial [Alkalihalobacillus hemicellulosilyticus]|uniref:LPXTG cell wall anchor domain-containing protein n=1 Tax=Halalkalibacter hemicellulosilyticus TaxID=127886 RepID=UPI000553EACE
PPPGGEEPPPGGEEPPPGGEEPPLGDSKDPLPDTATNLYQFLLIGISLLFVGGIVYLFKRRKQEQ